MIRVDITIECSECGAAKTYQPKQYDVWTDARRQARKMGWKVGTMTRRDLCPECKTKGTAR